MDQRCEHCNALHFADEKIKGGFNSCCHRGHVRLERMEYPHFLRELMSNTAHPHFHNFYENSRSYNAALSFASMGAQITERAGKGPYCFTANGQVYHRTSHLLPPEGVQPKYAQLYVLDSAQATEHRMRLPPNQNCLPEVMTEIDAFLRVNNLYATTYRMMFEIERDEVDIARRENRPLPNISLVLRRDRRSRRFDLLAPTANEIGMIFTTVDGEPPFDRDLKVYARDPGEQPLLKLKIRSPHLDPMVYAILFPFGEPGWQPGMRGFLNTERKVSMLQYKSYLTAVRDYFNPVMRAGKLTQQWIVDSYLQVEANDLNYIRTHQQDLKVYFCLFIY